MIDVILERGLNVQEIGDFLVHNIAFTYIVHVWLDLGVSFICMSAFQELNKELNSILTELLFQ